MQQKFYFAQRETNSFVLYEYMYNIGLQLFEFWIDFFTEATKQESVGTRFPVSNNDSYFMVNLYLNSGILIESW